MLAAGRDRLDRSPLCYVELHKFVFVSQMSNFLQDQGKRGIVRRRTASTPHKQIPQLDAEIAEKGHL
jgi:hypothetical protein